MDIVRYLLVSRVKDVCKFLAMNSFVNNEDHGPSRA